MASVGIEDGDGTVFAREFDWLAGLGGAGRTSRDLARHRRASLIQPVPLLPPDRKTWLEVGAESTMALSGFQFFHVPEDVEQFELSFLPSYTRERFETKLDLAAGAILNPDAEPVAPISCALETRPAVVKVEVPKSIAARPGASPEQTTASSR